MIPGDLLSAFPHRQFHKLPGLLDSWAALPNSNPNACMPMQGGSLYHFYEGLWYDPAGRRTHDLPCERRTRYRLSQPDTVLRYNSKITKTKTKYCMVDLYSFNFLEKTHTVKICLIVSNFINIKFVNERVAEELYDLSNKVNSTQTSELNGRNVARFSILLSKILARFRQTVYVHQMTRVSKCSALFSRYFPSHRFVLKRFIGS